MAFAKSEVIIIGNSKINGTDVGRDLVVPVSNGYEVLFRFTRKLKKAAITFVTK